MATQEENSLSQPAWRFVKKKKSRHLPSDALQLVAGCGQIVAGLPGVVESHHGLAHRPIASLSAAHEIPLVVSTTGTATLAVRAAAIDGGIAMTSTYLKGAGESSAMNKLC